MNPIANLSTTQNVNRPQTAQGYNNRPYFGNEEAVSDEVMLSSTPQEDEAAAKKRKMWTIGGAILGTLAIAIGVASGIGTFGKLGKEKNLKGLKEGEIFKAVAEDTANNIKAADSIKLGTNTKIALNSQNFFSNGIAWGGGTYNSTAYAVKDALGSKKTMYYVGSEDNFKKLQEALEKTYEKKEDAPTIEHLKINDKTTEWKDLEDATVESIADKLKGENNFVLFGTEASNLFDGIQSDDRDSCKKLIEAWENKSAPAADPAPAPAADTANNEKTNESNGTAKEVDNEKEKQTVDNKNLKSEEEEHKQSIIKINASGEIFKKVPATGDKSESPAINLGKGTQVALNPQNENLSAVKDALGSKTMYYVGSEDNFKKLQEALEKTYENKEDAPKIEHLNINDKTEWKDLEDATVESIANTLKGENNFVLFGTEASNLLEEINSGDNRKLCDKLIKAFENEKKNKLNNESVANDGNDDKEDLESSSLSQPPIAQEDEDLLSSPKDVTNRNSDVLEDSSNSSSNFLKDFLNTAPAPGFHRTKHQHHKSGSHRTKYKHHKSGSKPPTAQVLTPILLSAPTSEVEQKNKNKYINQQANSQQPIHQTQNEGKKSDPKVAETITEQTYSSLANIGNRILSFLNWNK